MPRPSPAPWAPKRLAPPSRRQCSGSFPRPTRSHAHRCSRASQHSGEQSGLVTLIFDLFTLKVVSHVTWVTSVPILVFLGLSVLDSVLDATDVRQTDVRQHHRFMPSPIRGGGIMMMMIIIIIVMTIMITSTKYVNGNSLIICKR